MAEKKEKRYVSDNAQLMAEWDWERNAHLVPSYTTLSSHKKVWWKCEKRHEWQATIANRSYGTGCPYCACRKVLKGFNDLQTVNPDLATEWNYDKNDGLTPSLVTPNSNKKVWWKCFKGHEWQSTVYNRNHGYGCPVCNSERHTSFPEYALLFYLQKCEVEIIHSYKAKGYELDIYIPSKNIAIEYDGYFWHKKRTKNDLSKNQKCQKNGIILYRVREGLPPLNGTSKDYIIQKNQSDLPRAIAEILREITNRDVDVNLERDALSIESLREYTEKNNSLLFSNPILANEWNYEKNGKLKPEHISVGSGKKVWWKCSEGHEWKAIISSRNRGNGCPYCSGRIVLKGENDLQTVNPVLASEWNYEKNGELIPTDVSSGSNKKVWWKCSKGHEWQASIVHRTGGTQCPYCSNLYPIAGETDLETINPSLAQEWCYGRNDGLTPKDVLPNSDKKVWWRCSKGHEWQASIGHRNNGRGCPYCASRQLLRGFNDLQTINPALASEWNFEKNAELTPSEVMPNSSKKAWWKCQRGHEWQAKIQNRNNGRGCPYCASRKVLMGFNDLQTLNPTLASEWCYEKNGDFLPTDVMPNSDRKAWWRCAKGHVWQAVIANRNAGCGCPYCAGKKH